jgi:hypothetical protein
VEQPHLIGQVCRRWPIGAEDRRQIELFRRFLAGELGYDQTRHVYVDPAEAATNPDVYVVPPHKPARIQYRHPRSGWTLPAGAIYVGRHTDPTIGRWGNPFDVATALERGFATDRRQAALLCVARHRRWLAGDPDISDVLRLHGHTYDRRLVLAGLHTLAGHNLACWCPLPVFGHPDVCHGATLLTLAAQAAETGGVGGP